MTPEGGKLAYGVVPGSERVVRTEGINTSASAPLPWSRTTPSSTRSSPSTPLKVL